MQQIKIPAALTNPLDQHAFVLRLGENAKLLANVLHRWRKGNLTGPHFKDGTPAEVVGGLPGRLVRIPPRLKASLPRHTGGRVPTATQVARITEVRAKLHAQYMLTQQWLAEFSSNQRHATTHDVRIGNDPDAHFEVKP